MRRRSFLQGLFAMPVLAALWPRAGMAHAAAPTAKLTYSDSEGTADLSVLCDGDLTTGIEYQP